MVGPVNRLQAGSYMSGGSAASISARWGSRRGGSSEHDHRADEHGAPERLRAELEQRGGDVGAVGETDGGEARGVEAVAFARGGEPVGKRVGAARDFGGIEHALGEPCEKTQRAAFIHIAARTQHGRSRRDRAPDPNQIVFVAARAVQQQQRWRRRIGRRLEHMMVRELGRGAMGHCVAGETSRAMKGCAPPAQAAAGNEPVREV